MVQLDTIKLVSIMSPKVVPLRSPKGVPIRSFSQFSRNNADGVPITSYTRKWEGIIVTTPCSSFVINHFDFYRLSQVTKVYKISYDPNEVQKRHI